MTLIVIYSLTPNVIVQVNPNGSNGANGLYFRGPTLLSRMIAIGGIVVFCTFGAGCSRSSKNTAAPPSPPETASPRVTPAIFEAALQGDLVTIKSVLKNGVPAGAADENGRTLLMLAAFNGHTAVANALLGAGASVMPKDSIGRTALMYAASGPFPGTVELLLAHGAPLDDTDSNEHFSALMFAAAEGQADVVRLLLQRGANPAIKDVDGDTAADFARKNNHTEVESLLTNTPPRTP